MKDYQNSAIGQVDIQASQSFTGMAPHVQEINKWLGDAVVLLPCPQGEKGSRDKGWQQTTLDQTKTPEYQHRLNSGNIAVLLGSCSGNLCAIDLDTEEGVKAFFAVNPKLQATLRTQGKRGCQVWVRISGAYPEKIIKIKDSADGEIGEWRGGEGCSMIYGRHPDGMLYNYLVRASPMEITFGEINWPQGWTIPGLKTGYDRLVESVGEPYVPTRGNGVVLNEHFFAQNFALANEILFEPESGRFFKYSADTGLWKSLSKDELKHDIFLSTQQFSEAQDPLVQKAVPHAAKNRFLDQVSELLKGKIKKSGAFDHPKRWIHVKNGIVLPCGWTSELIPFGPGCYSRSQCPVDFLPDAACPRFQKFVNEVLGPDDADLLQRIFGYILMPGNPAHKIFVLHGVAESGKSTLGALLEMIVGRANVGQLRTQHFGNRFELGGLLGKPLLTGKDVPADFLAGQDAQLLKCLVGDDSLDAELKNANERVSVRGNFHVFIISNHRLVVEHSDDSDAWKRRLIILEFERRFAGKRVVNYAESLFQEEGPGILAWAIRGLLKVDGEIETTGDFILTPSQRLRVDSLLAESASLELFLKERVVPGSGNLTTQELSEAYRQFCAEHGWMAIPAGAVAKDLPMLVSRLFRVERSHNLPRDGSALRGFRGIIWRMQNA